MPGLGRMEVGLKVAVIGLGSMGRRRIRLIRKYDPSIEIIGIDNNEQRREVCYKEYGIDTFSHLSECFSDKIDGAFVCTSPLSHHEIITECLSRSIHVFTELNLVTDGYDKNIKLAYDKELKLFLSSTFLYRDEIKKIISLVRNSSELLNYTYHIGQYLPDWHPWESYKNFFVDDKRSNGCREIFAIELPWLTESFGAIVDIKVKKSKMSNLEIDYFDNYLVLLEHSTGHKGTLAVDVVSRKAVRNLEVFGEDLYLSWNGSPTGLYQYDYEKKEDKNIELYEAIDQLEDYSSFVVENAYSNEIIAFFETIINGKPQLYSFEKDKEILGIIDRIEA